MADGDGKAGDAPRGAVGSTSWYIALTTILDRIASMHPGRAGDDARAIAAQINKILAAVEGLNTFGQDHLEGEAAKASEAAAKKIFGDITSATSEVAPSVGALTSAQNVLEVSQSQAQTIRNMQATLASPSNTNAYLVMTEAAKLMTDTYNHPMSAAASQVPSSPTSDLNPGGGGGGVGGTGGGGTSGGGGGGGGTRMTSGNASDMGEYGGKTDPAGKPAGADNPAGPGGGPSNPTGGTSSNDSSGPSNGARNASADEPGGLDRGGRGMPDDQSNHTNTAGMMPGGMPAGGSSGSPSGGRGGGGIGGVGGAGGVSELSRRLSASVPSSTTPAGQAPVSAGGPTSRNGMSPGGAPHGAGRGRAGEDSRHKSAHYLHTRDNGEEIVGSLPLVGPPVIGDWAPAGPSHDESAKEAGAEEPANPDKPLNLG